jgi:hypothetical protein
VQFGSYCVGYWSQRILNTGPAGGHDDRGPKKAQTASSSSPRRPSDNGALDLASVDRMVGFYLERGANGRTILGVMGEAPKLTEEESRAFIGRAIARASRGARHRRRVGTGAGGDQDARSERDG